MKGAGKGGTVAEEVAVDLSTCKQKMRFIFKNRNNTSPPAFKRKQNSDIEDDFNPGSATFGVRRELASMWDFQWVAS